MTRKMGGGRENALTKTLRDTFGGPKSGPLKGQGASAKRVEKAAYQKDLDKSLVGMKKSK